MEYINTLHFAPEEEELSGRNGVEFHVRTGPESLDGDYGQAQKSPYDTLNVLEFSAGGIAYSFAGESLKALALHMENGLLNDELAADSVTAEIYLEDKVQLSHDTPVYIKRDGEIVGVFYNAQITEIGYKTKKLYAESIVSLLEYSDHVGGVYDGSQNIGDLVADILPAGSYIIDKGVAEIKAYGYLPYASKRDNLLQVIIATGASIRKMADGRMNITAIKKGGDIILDNSQAFEGGNISETAPVTRLELTEHTYAKGGEPIKLYEGSVMEEEVIRFSEPAYDLTIENGTILESSANYAKVRGSGNVILNGTKYIHTTRVLGKGEVTATTKAYQVKGAYLVNPLNSSSALERLYTYARCNRTIIQDVFVENERPGDMVSVIDPHTGLLETAAIQSLDVTFSKSMRAHARFLVGYVPQGISTGYQNRVLITKTGSFTVPADVTEIGVVLIGGGTGGHSGHPGEDGTSGWSSTPYGGEGGKGSKGGGGGRVLQLTLQVNPGDVIAIAIGTGGTGAAFSVGNEEGNEGTATTFGDYSSDDGSVMKYGYIDLYSGDAYAIDGIEGVDGAAGGRGGNNSDGVAGENVGTAVGGTGGLRYKSSAGHAGGGGGGGAAYGKNGSDGTDGKYKPITFTGGSGGNGATPVKAATGATPGQGGQGGHGGGGGGGGGAVNNSENGSDGEWGGSEGSGGNGGAGGNGAAGCVIIYY